MLSYFKISFDSLTVAITILTGCYFRAKRGAYQEFIDFSNRLAISTRAHPKIEPALRLPDDKLPWFVYNCVTAMHLMVSWLINV